MSRGEACPYCGTDYGRFRTGLTFGDVRAMLWSSDPDPATWRHKSRGVVLGMWRGIKLAMWSSHVAECAYHFDTAEDDAEADGGAA